MASTELENLELSLDSRFDLAYNSAHAFSLAALRLAGYRSDNRYTAFQALPHSAGIDTITWRVLSKAHDQRNIMEYEGGGEVDSRLLEDLVIAAGKVGQAVSRLLAQGST